MSDLGWTIESIGYNKDKNAYIAKVSAGAAGSAIVTNAIVTRNKESKSDNFQLIVFIYLITGFAVGTWGYIKQSIIWLSAAKQGKVKFNSALAHVLIPPFALCFPVLCVWIAGKNNWLPVGMSPATIIVSALILLMIAFFVAYLSLSSINKHAQVDDFIGVGSAVFQSASCLIAYGALTILLVTHNADSVASANKNQRSNSAEVKQTDTKSKNTNKQSSAFDAMSADTLTQDKAGLKEATNGHKAFVYDPPSNVRVTPDGKLLCTINQTTNVNIYDYAASTYDGSREVKWYYTDACGSMGVIAHSQFR